MRFDVSSGVSVRRGFTIVEVVAAIAIIAILGSLTIPGITRYLEAQEIDTTESILSDLKNSIANFRATVGNSPSRLTHLTRNITSTDTTSCTGRAPATPVTLYGATNAAKWVNAGPYYSKALSVYGFPLPIGTASDTLFRTQTSLKTAFLNITIRFVRFQDAVKLNDAVDGSADVNQPDRSNNSGQVQWGAPSASERVDVTFGVPVGRIC